MKTKNFEQLAKDKIQTDKNTYLLTCLEIACKTLKEQEVFTPTHEGSTSFHFVPSHVNEVGESIAKTLQNCRYHDMRLILTGEDFSYAVDLRSVETMKKELEQEIRIDWSKKCYRQKGGDDWGYTIQSKFPGNSIPTFEYYLNPKNYRALAESFNSAEEITEDIDCINVANNLESAKNALKLLMEGTETLSTASNKNQIKHAQSMVDLWQEHVTAWEQIYKIGLTLDYDELAKWKHEQELNKQAEENEAICALHGAEHLVLGYTSKRDMFDLFTKYGVKPVNDVNVIVSLKVAEEINTEVKYEHEWKQLENGEQEMVGTHEVKRYRDFDEYLSDHKLTYQVDKKEFSDKYILKKTGGYKIVSHRERGRRDGEKARLEKDSLFIDALMRNEQEIKKYLIKQEVNESAQ